MGKNAKIYVAGHRGMVGSALVRRLERGGYENLIVRRHDELDLLDQSAVHAFMGEESPDYVFLAAAKVGGIQANDTYRADFIYENLAIEVNVIHAAYQAGVPGLLFLGSSCIYPRDCPQPIREEYLLTGPLEPTNEPYAIAKIAGIELCEAYNRQYGTKYGSVMPTNLYGPNDNFDLETSHVIPALLRKMHDAKVQRRDTVTIWGTGKPRREFLHVDDLADACVFLMEREFSDGLINVGSGSDLTIRELAEAIRGVVGFQGDLSFDDSKPDGTPRKLMDNSKMRAMGWRPRQTLESGLKDVYDWYVADHHATSGSACV